MPVYTHIRMLARKVLMPHRDYHDLVIIPGAEPRYGIFDQTRDLWRETFDEATCRARLAQWADQPSYSEVTQAGRQWLASMT